MNIARLHNPLSQTLIRRLGDAGGPRGDQVDAELDNIVDGVNTGRVEVIHTSLPVANPGVGTVTTSLATIAGGTLAANGEYLKVDVFGRFTSSANNKEIRLNANQGGTNILVTTGTFTTGSPAIWEATALIRRDTSSNFDSRGHGIKANAIYGQAEFFSGGWNFANSFTIEVVTVLATALEVFIDRVLIVRYGAP